LSKSDKKLLIVDDDHIIRDSLSEFLSIEGYECGKADSFGNAIKELELGEYHIVITDVNMPESNGFELLKLIRKRYPHIVTIIITGYGTIESAVEAIKMGAYDYLTKPIVDDEIRMVIARACEQQSLLEENRSLKKQLKQKQGIDNIVGQDPKMLRIYDLIESVSESKATVLITGKSGTGKSMFARAIHQRSDRCDKPFVEVSCGALPETLLDSELFGHAKGAFTGAVNDKEGKFLAANGGTIFLDEINSATPAFQLKLLRVLQERQFEPVGSNVTKSIDVRVVLATNQDLQNEVTEGRFREDLFYRINVVTLEIPLLKERMSDVLLLADRFLRMQCNNHGKKMSGFAEDVILAMESYLWPGNVRELENAIERGVVLGKTHLIELHNMPNALVDHAQANPARDTEMVVECPRSLKNLLEVPEKRFIEEALRKNNWNRQLTAEQLEINRTTLYKKIKRYNLESEHSDVN